jgi:ankyrin repeat protein
MLAAYYGHADLVKLLIQHDADPNRLNDRGQSPLAGAVFKMEDKVIEVGFVIFDSIYPNQQLPESFT